MNPVGDARAWSVSRSRTVGSRKVSMRARTGVVNAVSESWASRACRSPRVNVRLDELESHSSIEVGIVQLNPLSPVPVR